MSHHIPDATKMINDGGPAYPMGYHPEGNSADHSGMTLRDYFAAAALQGLLGNPQSNSDWDESDVAKFCYDQANEMLKAREAK